MQNNKVIIVWKPDVLSMVEHTGSFENKDKVNNHKGLTVRSEVESFSNIKSIEAAERLLNRRNKSEMVHASYNDQIIYSSHGK